MALNLSAALQSSPVHSFLRPVRLKALDSSNRAPREFATPHHTLSNQCTLQPQPPSFLVSTRFLCQLANGHNHDTIERQLSVTARSRWSSLLQTRGIRLFAFFLGKRPDAEPSLKERALAQQPPKRVIYTIEHATDEWEGREVVVRRLKQEAVNQRGYRVEGRG